MTDKCTNFSLFYDSFDDSSPLKKHEMSLSELGDALKGISDVLTIANQQINGDDEPIIVRVKGGFRPGSFGIPIEVIQSVTSVDVLAVLGLVACGGQLVIGSALEVIRQLRSRKIDIIEQIDADQVKIKVGGDEIICCKHAKKLITNKQFREAVSEVFKKPVDSGDIDQIGIKFDDVGDSQPDQHTISLLAGDAAGMSVPDEIFQRDIEERSDETTVVFLTVHIDKSNLWRVRHHGRVLSVDITDQVFLKSLRLSDESFSFSQEFRVRMKTTISRRRGSSRESKAYEIEHVYI